MKNASCFFAATLTLFFGLNLSLNAQKTATWKGGAPGKTTEWTYAGNWREGRVPDAFSDVVIPDVSTAGGFLPVIRTDVGGVNSLTVLSDAQLRIEASGALEVFEMLEVLYSGKIQNNGHLIMPVGEQAHTAYGPMGFASH